MVVLAIFACIFLAIVMIKIVKAMMSMIDHLDAVAEGNLESRISDRMTSRSDEIGNIARALYSLIGGLAMIVKTSGHPQSRWMISAPGSRTALRRSMSPFIM